MTERLLTVEEVAEFLNVSRMTVYRMIRRGQIGAQKVGGQFRIDPSFITKLRLKEDLLKSKPIDMSLLLRFEDAWVARFRPVFMEFVNQQFYDFKPDWVVMNHRKAARFFEATELIPVDYADKTVYWEAFHWRSDEKRRQELKGKRVLILDESVQRGRQLKRLRVFFERYGAKVETVALIRRKSCLTEGTLQDTQVISCMDLDDKEFSYMAANMLNTAILGTIPLDTDHLRFVFNLNNTGFETADIEELIASIGEIYFLPSPVNRKELLCMTIELHDCFEWERLLLPQTVKKEGACKLRVFYDTETKMLNLVPIIFPKVELKSDDVLKLVGTIGEPWSHYMIILDDFRDLFIDVQCEIIHRLFVNYCTVKLGLIAISHIMGLLPDNCVKHENIEAKYEDWIKLWGPKLGSEIKKVIENDIEQGLRKLIFLPRDKRELMNWKINETRERNEYSSAMWRDTDESVEIICQRVIEVLREYAEANNLRGMSFTELEVALPDVRYHFLSRAVDILLDGGLIKPDFEVRKLDNETFVGIRSYALSEFGSWFEGPRAFTTEDIAERKLAKLLPYSLQRFLLNDVKPRDGLVQKVFTNLQHDWDYRRFDPLFLGWVPYLYGPLVIVPKKRAPYGGFHSLREFGRAQNLLDLKSLKSGIWKSALEVTEDKVLEDMEPEELDFLEGLLDIYRSIYSDGDDETTNILRTLAACRNRRLTYICSYEELTIWREHVNTLIDRIEREITTLPEGLTKFPKGRTIEPLLEDIANAHVQLEDKLNRYKTLASTKERLERILETHPRRTLTRLLLEKLEVPINLSDTPPYPLGRLLLYEPVVGCFSSMLRQGFSSLRLARDTRREKIDQYTGEEKNVAWYANRLIDLCPELGVVKADLDEFVNLVNSGQRVSSIAFALRRVFNQILTILKRDIPTPPPPQKYNYFRIDPEGFRKKILEEVSKLKGTKTLACVVVDAHGFVPSSEWLAQQLKVDPNDARETLQRLMQEAMIDLASRMNPIHFIPLGGDGALLTFSSLDHAVSFSCQLQNKLDRNFVRFVKMGIDIGDPRADYGAPYGTAFITAYYLTEKTGLYPGQIAVTQEAWSVMEDSLKKRCIKLGRYTFRNRREPIDVFVVEWRNRNQKKIEDDPIERDSRPFNTKKDYTYVRGYTNSSRGKESLELFT